MPSINRHDLTLEAPRSVPTRLASTPARRRNSARILCGMLLATAAACAPDATAPGTERAATIVVAPPSFAKVATNSKANMRWDDVVLVSGVPTAAGIQGDDRNRFGLEAEPTDEYQGALCGVRAEIYNGDRQNGNLDFDYDMGIAQGEACGGLRKLRIHLAGAANDPTISGPHSMAYGIWTMGAGEVRTQGMDFGVQLPDCQRLSFDGRWAAASSVKITRLPDVTTDGAVARQWRIESQGTHTAACIVSAKGGRWQDMGTWYVLPFAVTVTEVPYPAPTSP